MRGARACGSGGGGGERQLRERERGAERAGVAHADTPAQRLADDSHAEVGRLLHRELQPNAFTSTRTHIARLYENISVLPIHIRNNERLCAEQSMSTFKNRSTNTLLPEHRYNYYITVEFSSVERSAL